MVPRVVGADSRGRHQVLRPTGAEAHSPQDWTAPELFAVHHPATGQLPLMEHLRTSDGALTQDSKCALAVGPTIFAKTLARPEMRRTQPAGWRWCTSAPYHPYADTAGIPAVLPPMT